MTRKEGLQEALALLVTHRPSRELFFARAEEALTSIALSSKELEALAGISREHLERYAHSLASKRWDEVARVIPLSVRVAPSLPRRYRAWLLDHPAAISETQWLLSPGAAEALRVVDPLRREVHADSSEARYLADLLVFETFQAASRGDGRTRRFSSRTAIHEVAREIEEGRIPIDVDAAPHDYELSREVTRWKKQ